MKVNYSLCSIAKHICKKSLTKSYRVISYSIVTILVSVFTSVCLLNTYLIKVKTYFVLLVADQLFKLKSFQFTPQFGKQKVQTWFQIIYNMAIFFFAFKYSLWLEKLGYFLSVSYQYNEQLLSKMRSCPILTRAFFLLFAKSTSEALDDCSVWFTGIKHINLSH